MGAGVTIEKWPKQGSHFGRAVMVWFDEPGNAIEGCVVRDDIERPFVKVIKLIDGRYVLESECQCNLKYPREINK